MLASEVMDQALIFLNDATQSLYTYTVQLPYLKRATEDLERELAVNGIQVQRTESSVITVNAGDTYIALPTDFFLPIALFERNVGENDNQWLPMTERDWEPLGTALNVIEYWAFRDNKIQIRPCSVTKEVSLRYIRSLAVISSQSSSVDITASKGFLAARTAELCARYIGMNSSVADGIASREVEPSRDTLIRAFILQGQNASRGRRKKFQTKRLEVR